ncbi:MAG: ABC transporter permease [Chloroflexota bacterium]
MTLGGRLGGVLTRTVALVGFVLIYAPFVVIVVLSFNDSPAATLPFKGFSLRWYERLLGNDAIIAAFGNTLLVGAIATIVSTTLGTVIALSLRRARFPGRSLYEFVLSLPFLLPEVIVGVATLSFLLLAGIRLSLGTIILAHILVTLVVAERTVAVRLAQIPASLEEASRDLGRSPIQTFFLITLPNLRSALIAAALLVFTVSFDQTIITFLVAGTDQTLPTYVWAQVRRGFTPELNVVAAIFLIASSLLGLAIAWTLRGTGSPLKTGGGRP